MGGVKFFERAEVKDILAYLRFFYNPNDTEAFERIIHKPRRGVGEVTLDKMQQLSRRNDWNVIKVLRELTSNKPSPELNMTVSAKVKQNLREFLAIFEDIRKMMKANVRACCTQMYFLLMTAYRSQFLKCCNISLMQSTTESIWRLNIQTKMVNHDGATLVNWSRLQSQPLIHPKRIKVQSWIKTVDMILKID